MAANIPDLASCIAYNGNSMNLNSYADFITQDIT